MDRYVMVEDEAELLEVFGSELQNRGYEVLSARSGAEALGLIRKWSTSIDVLVADVVLPQVSGISLAHKLLKRVPNAKVLLISGYGQLLSEDAGFPVLAKPMSPEALAERVESLAR